MFFKQVYLGCLAHASYVFGSEGIGAVVDPQRDVDEYLAIASAAGLRIAYVFETHVHADFVSGFRELAERTGATVVFGRRAEATFPHQAVRDGDVIRVGTLNCTILETPGHTPEGISILVTDREAPHEAPKLLTGDTLFVGDVGRPDLIGSKGYSSEQMAESLYDSLHQKLLVLDDAVEVYPAHGAGSLCGRNMSSETWSTIGAQRRSNYALQPMTKTAFVDLMVRGLPEQPAYFAVDADLNRHGVPALGAFPRPTALSPAEAEGAMRAGAVLLDVRSSEEFLPLHAAGSRNIGLDGQFAAWAGALLSFDRPIVLLGTDGADVDEAVLRLARIGLATVIGYVEGGIEEWQRAGLPVRESRQIDVDELDRLLALDPGLSLVDVRRQAEIDAGVAPGAVPITLTELEAKTGMLDTGRRHYIVCGSGYRSSIAISMLEAAGFHDLVDVAGGMGAYVAAGHRVDVPQPA